MTSEIIDRRTPFGKAAFVFVIIACVFLGVKTLAELKQYRTSGTAPQQNVISVTGHGEVSAVPDIATLTFSVVEQGADVKTAQDKATKRMNDSIAFLKGAGVAEKDIKTSNYNIYPRYEYQTPVCKDGVCPTGQQRLVGYEVSQGVTVKIRDISKAGTVLAGIGSLGVQNVSQLAFSIDKEDALKQDARTKAIADARTKAKALAKELNVGLGRIVSFQESGAYPPIMYDKAMLQSSEASGGRAVAPTVAPDLPTGENSLTSDVTIVYQIR
jgi:uncharacterized protein YggE